MDAPKSIGGRWQAYLKEKMAAALNRRSAWFLFGLAFISVYREVFESILFYAALLSNVRPGSVATGRHRRRCGRVGANRLGVAAYQPATADRARSSPPVRH
ncbi:FTR1 family protein [Rhodanobacter lindaniclasticus]